MALIAEKEFDGNHRISMDGYLMDGSDSVMMIDIFSSFGSHEVGRRTDSLEALGQKSGGQKSGALRPTLS